jgi:hypothetical protein
MPTNGLKLLKENWFLILAIVSIVISYTSLGVRLGDCEQDYVSHFAESSKYEDALHECQAEIREIKVDLKYLKESAVRNETLSREILKELRE